MKTSSQVLLVIFVLIIAGVFYRFSGTYIEAKKDKKEAASAAQTTETSLNMPSTDTPVQVTEPYIAIMPEKFWPELLLGKWDYFESERTEHDAWFMEGNLELKKNKTFRLQTHLSYYDYDNDVKSNEKRQASIEGSGFVNGTWNVMKGQLLLKSDSCNINRTYYADKEYPYSKQDYSAYDMRGCDYFEVKNIGTYSDNENNMKTEKFNKDSIWVTGKNFGSGTDVTFIITKQ